jgi:hypothetical protein
MSVVFSGTNQGRFTSVGTNVSILLTSEIDWMWVYNESVLYGAGAGTGAQFYWQRGMAQGRGVQYTKTAVTGALAVSQIAANEGFFLIDDTVNVPGPSLSLSGITSGNPPVVNTTNTASLSNGSVVRIFSTVGAKQLGGLDFTIGALSPGSSFELAYMAAIANANPGAGTFRVIPYNPYFYPSTRFITKISQATQAIVTLSVDHRYTVGQSVRLIIPTVTATAFGMTQLNGVEATIVAIGQADTDGITNTITINVDTTGFSPFVFPLTTDPGFTPAQVVPIGEDTATALQLGANILGDSTVNEAGIGIQLIAGANSPGGVDGNVIYWVAGSSFEVDNE